MRERGQTDEHTRLASDDREAQTYSVRTRARGPRHTPAHAMLRST